MFHIENVENGKKANIYHDEMKIIVSALLLAEKETLGVDEAQQIKSLIGRLKRLSKRE